MSTHNRILVLIGLITVVGSLGWASRDNDGADEPPPAPFTTPPIGTEPSRPRERLLLLNGGQIISGVVTEEGSQYILTQRIGVLRFPKKRVEGMFDSILDVYRYKLEQLPERDSEERFKLARWCLNHKLTAQAKDQLTKVLELNSQNRQARFMLLSIDQESVRIAQRKLDPDVRQTRADSMTEERPLALDSAVIQGARRDLKIPSSPVIFDLPTPLAILRTQEFGRHVHPLLQALCAKCHNGEYDGPFQLVPIKTRADRTPEAFRANLDITLRFIDKDNPSKSELLSSMLRPHGYGPNPRPIFPGSNDQAYQVLATWVKNLRPTGKISSDVSRAAPARTATADGETFAADHDRIGREPAELALPGYSDRSEQPMFAGGQSREAMVPPPARPGVSRGAAREDSIESGPQKFPIPFAVSGAKPELPPRKTAPKSAAGVVVDEKAKDQTTAKDKAATAKNAAKPGLKLDPELLQRALQSRNLNNRQ